MSEPPPSQRPSWLSQLGLLVGISEACGLLIKARYDHAASELDLNYGWHFLLLILVTVCWLRSRSHVCLGPAGTWRGVALRSGIGAIVLPLLIVPAGYFAPPPFNLPTTDYVLLELGVLAGGAGLLVGPVWRLEVFARAGDPRWFSTSVAALASALCAVFVLAFAWCQAEYTQAAWSTGSFEQASQQGIQALESFLTLDAQPWARLLWIGVPVGFCVLARAHGSRLIDQLALSLGLTAVVMDPLSPLGGDSSGIGLLCAGLGAAALLPLLLQLGDWLETRMGWNQVAATPRRYRPGPLVAKTALGVLILVVTSLASFWLYQSNRDRAADRAISRLVGAGILDPNARPCEEEMSWSWEVFMELDGVLELRPRALLVPLLSEESPCDYLSADLELEARCEAERRACEELLSTSTQQGEVVPEQLVALQPRLDAVFGRLSVIEGRLDDLLAREGDPSPLYLHSLPELLSARALSSAASGDLDTAWADVERLLRLALLAGRAGGYGGALQQERRADSALKVLALVEQHGPPRAERRQRIRDELLDLDDPTLAQRALALHFVERLRALNDRVESVSGLERLALTHDRSEFVLWYERELRLYGLTDPAEVRELAAEQRATIPWAWTHEEIEDEGQHAMACVLSSLRYRVQLGSAIARLAPPDDFAFADSGGY